MYVRVCVLSCAHQCVRVRVRVRVSLCVRFTPVRACVRVRACVFVFVLTRACAIGVRTCTDVNIVRTQARRLVRFRHKSGSRSERRGRHRST